MSPLNLPDRASLEYLKKLAKERLPALRAADPAAPLAEAQLAIAREYGFASWRALKAEIDRRRAPNVAEFLRACQSGDLGGLRAVLAIDPKLARERVAGGTTGLHQAVRHPDAIRLLLEHGADPNLRDTGDNASALHFAAANGHLETVRVLLDAGADVRGAGDLHNGDVIGWAARAGNDAVIDVLLERGARHHIFSAMGLNDLDLVEKLVDEDPGCLLRRRSRFENEHTPVHAAFVPPDGLGFLCGRPNYAILERLIALGADVDAPDDKGRTPLAIALLRGDREAVRLLRAAGAREPQPAPEDAPRSSEKISATANSVKKAVPMFLVRDMRATVRWYELIGFRVEDRYEDGGELMFARLSFGDGELTLSPGGTRPRDVSLWFFTDRVRDVYTALKDRQLRTAHAAQLDSEQMDVRFVEDLYEPFYGGLQFSVQDNNGLHLIFWQPVWLAPAAGSTP